eukprot:TRINITY_DN26374_c1_g3_i1.p1 TRINITY_DN26374_c1_g3~~TRINITY_DN26374_c1_g3_i1.p1  ORF type:complete len:231 (+),score=67.97 TRINITY_DN26374_c1_g3_i1:64-756(+)
MAEPATKKAKVESLGTLTYFPLFAKGLAPALCAELSGLAWKSNKDTGFAMDKWEDLKASGKPPFGQLPILETDKGMVIGQTTAICNYIGRVSGLEGKDDEDFATSQMLIAAGEDLYNLMQKYQPTKFVKSKSEDNNKFWSEILPAEAKKLQALLEKGPNPAAGFTSSTSVGELYFFAMLHQAVLVTSDCLAPTPALQKWYESMKALPGVAKVLAGDSAFGTLEQYFVPVQ